MSWLVILFVLASLPWLLVVAPRTEPVRFAAIILAIGTVFGPNFFSINGPVQLSLDRILLAGLVMLMAIRVLRFGDRIESLSRLDVVVVLFAVWSLANCAVYGLTKGDPPAIARWLFTVAVPVVIYFSVRIRPTTGDSHGRRNDSESRGDNFQRSVQWAITILITLCVYLALTSVFEQRGWRALVFPRFINDPEHWEFFGRGRGPLLNPIGNGMVITLGLCACIVRFFSSGRVGKIGYGTLAAITLAGAICTMTRSVWMGAFLAGGLLCFSRVPMRLRIVTIVAGAILIGAMFAGLKDHLLAFKRDESLSAAQTKESVELRPLLALVAYEMFKDRPITGHGFGQYRQKAKPYHTIRNYDMPLEKVRPYVQHNLFLSYLTDLGLVGLSLHLFVLVGIFCLAWGLKSTGKDDTATHAVGMLMVGWLAAYFVNGIFHDLSIITTMTSYLMFLVGLTVTSHQVQAVGTAGASAGVDRRAARSVVEGKVAGPTVGLA
ncbi:O-Antigen ligase [Crateriforma conspicua]|uniref:O-Antigen ligase n=1 Tax=Crateriforma conspicua TaxID=2527996 RepID=A0A5C6FTG2_9PLAN|nr:O-antigen ligase family protein [Crateriforma conspicua]TWU66287.1 O-Antigen ligase [Crateriforma conspicua]